MFLYLIFDIYKEQFWFLIFLSSILIKDIFTFLSDKVLIFIEQPFVTIDNKKYLKTNDIGKLGIDGNLYIIGRMDNIISLKSGNKISKETIEKRIREIDEIIDCKVFLDKDNICAEVVTDSSDKEMEERILKLTFRRK